MRINLVTLEYLGVLSLGGSLGGSGRSGWSSRATDGELKGGESIILFEFLKFASGNFFHLFTDFVDVRTLTVVKLAVVPDELEIAEEFLVSAEFAGKQILFECVKIHWSLDDLGVVE